MGILDSMMSGAKRSPVFGGVDSIIGENARFKGELITTGSANISGELEGKIKSEGEVIISPTGKVIGEVHGGTVMVSGRVDGNITAKESLEISKTGKVHGDLTGGKIIIEDGSSYHGRVKVESALAAKEEEIEEPTPTVPEPVVEEKPQTTIFPNF